MTKYIDQKQLVTIVVAGIAIFFLQKWFTKKITKADGSTSSYVGHESVGYM